MKKLYAFLIIALVALGVISSEVAHATYTISNYLVRKVDQPDPQNLGSGNYWNGLTAGTTIATGYLVDYQGYLGYYTSTGIQLPFNITFADQSLTTTNTFTVTTNGDVILSPHWGASWEYYAYCGYNYSYGYMYGQSNSSNYWYEYDYGMDISEEDEGSYGYYANYTLCPFSGYMYNYLPYFSGNIPKWQYAVLGSAPNRELVVESDYQHPFEESFFAAAGPDYGSWQVVMYENAISKFQFNFGPTVGDPLLAAYQNGYDGGGPVTTNGWTMPGSWCYDYNYNYSSYQYDFDYRAVCGIKSTGGQCITVDWNGNGWNANQPFIYRYGCHYGYYGEGSVSNYSTATGTASVTSESDPGFFPDTAYYLPRSSIEFFIAYPYDFTAEAIDTPVNESPYNINTPFTPTVTIQNSGSSVPASLQVVYWITEVGVGQVYSKTITVLPTAQAASGTQPAIPALPAAFSQAIVQFPQFTPSGVNGYGIYEDTCLIYNLLPTADQNPGDNELTNEWICSPPNDIKAVTVINPPAGSRQQISTATPIAVRFRNLGSNNQTHVPLTAVVHDASGNVVFRDTLIIPNWPAGPTGGNSTGAIDRSTNGTGPGTGPYYDTAFPWNPTWTPVTLGTDTVFGIAIMYPQNGANATDGLAGDDTTKASTPILPSQDAAAVAIIVPGAGQQMPQGISFQPEASFAAVGVNSLFDFLVYCQITRCSDGSLVFKSDTEVEAINTDDGAVPVKFPADNGIYHTSNLAPGCYNICAIVKYPGDINPTNDTVCGQFAVISRLSGNYYVGVGRQFQTIHQAVDTMRFRGIGGNVNLILTDASYTENGATDVASPYGAIDLRGINGLSATSTVTWEPYPGQTPTITFSGTQPFCFYMGDLFPGYMKWEGYNPSTVPTADKLVAEPAKRGLTIINNESNAGAVFGIEEGASNITLKDLILHGNANYANDSSAVVRLYNEHNFATFTAGVNDTIPINNIVINNCEIGNAKYGIYDHGFHDAYDPRLNGGTWRVWRNYNNVFTRNTVGTSANPLSYAGIQFNSENGIVISHNEISNISASIIPKAGGATQNVFGILQPNMNQYIGPTPANQGIPLTWPGDTGIVTGAWIDANRVRMTSSISGNNYGIALQQAAWLYTSPGLNPTPSSLPSMTQNRITNNMIYDLWTSAGGVYPIYTTVVAALPSAVTTFSADRDSIFNNSISTSNASANITVQYEAHAFLWNNILQNTGTGKYTNYNLYVPRPYASSISSDYNLFDLHGTANVFDSVTEYDARYGTVFQHLYFRRLNDWRTYVNQDMHSLTGNPLFDSTGSWNGTADSLRMPSALTYIESPASNNAAWLGTATLNRDFYGNVRNQLSPDIGADEWDGFQFTNDLAVQEIVQPAGFSQTSDTSLVTTASPLWINAVVKNLSSVGVYNQTATATVQVSTGGHWVTIATLTSQPLTWAVNESKNVIFQGPSLIPSMANYQDTGVYQVIVSVPNDQDNANNSQSKVFRVLLKQNATLLSYNGATADGKQNRDSVIKALGRLGIPYDIIDRNAPNGLPNTTIIDYTPWWTIIWANGDPGVAPVPTAPTGQAGPTLQETDEITRFLASGLTYAKKDFVIAGQHTAYDAAIKNQNDITDTNWLQTTMHTKYVGLYPTSTSYNGRIVGQQPAYWTFSDSLTTPTSTTGGEGTTDLSGSLTPNLVWPMLSTPAVGPIVNGVAYTYATHTADAKDSGAGVSYYDPYVNTVFYAFDWANPYQTRPIGNGDTTSGTTRTLAAAFAFFRSHQGTILPVDFVDASANYINGTNNALIKWSVSGQKDVATYNVEQQNQNSWTVLGHANAVDNQTDYAFTQVGNDPTQSYTYRIAAVDQTGAETYSNTIELGPNASQMGFSMDQNYPNPTTGVTQISFTLPEPSQVTVRVLDVTGKVVNSDVSNMQFAAGPQSVKLDLSSLPSGSYLYEMIATGADGQGATISKKLTLERQ